MREPVRVKICGITSYEDASLAVTEGADLVGFVLVGASPRRVSVNEAKEIVKKLPPGVAKVGLFRNEAPEKVVEAVCDAGFDHIQLHGEESPVYCHEVAKALSVRGKDVKIIKVFRIGPGSDGRRPEEYTLHSDLWLFDTFVRDIAGGSGEVFDWARLDGFKKEKLFFLAGGLTPENISEAVRTVRPYGVDVSSGVESSPGKKDRVKVKEFIQNAKRSVRT
jgi:phosphoribosylanthranilate isomerase